MSVVQIGAAIFGLIIVVLIVWNIRGHHRHGDGTVEERSDVWWDQL